MSSAEQMQSKEIDDKTLKLIVGLIALLLAVLTYWITGGGITSISESYHHVGLARDIFVGSLFAISSFLIAYNGESKKEMILSKVAAIAALGIALFPCDCGRGDSMNSILHYSSAGVMFISLAAFCFLFKYRAFDKKETFKKAARRVVVYNFCGLSIIFCIVSLAGVAVFFEQNSGSKLVFYFEAIALMAFSISWLTASKVFPFLAEEDERLSFFN